MTTYLVATEYISSKKSKGEVLVFRRGHKALVKKSSNDEEAVSGRNTPVAKTEDHTGIIARQTAIFHWQDVCYDIKIKGEPRRILDHVDGWVKPGTLTALMVCYSTDTNKPLSQQKNKNKKTYLGTDNFLRAYLALERQHC